MQHVFPRWKFAFVLLAVSIAFSSCYTYRIFPKEHRSYVYTGERKTAYVKNPGLVKEFTIFQAANIFNLISDSTDTNAVRIELLPVKRGMVCGQGIIASAITLGQVPVFLPDRYYYSFNETESTGTFTHHEYELQIATRYWFWDMFAFKKNFKKKAGQALLANYHTQKTVCSNCQNTSFIAPASADN